MNQKFVHSFTCAGILPSQYINFSQFAGIGNVGHKYIKQGVYNRRGYIEVVGQLAQDSMQAAVDEIQGLPEYPTKGEWVITDARHDSTANAFHTTVPCLSGSTMKIVGLSTLSRTEHSIPQTRELECTKIVVPQVKDRGLNIVEVAHDMQQQVSKFVTNEMKLVNSFDTWHGTKNVAKQLKKITQGPKKETNVSWFPELADKRKSIKIHLYWSMLNCNGCPATLRKHIENIPNHYQGDHSNCCPTSMCTMPGYTPSKVPLTKQKAVEELSRNLKATYVYRYAEDFCRCRDTYWVESFNHQLLTYLPKRIHFSTKVFDLRMGIALQDWNENVNRDFTSKHVVADLRRPDRRTPMKVLVKKTYKFVDRIWTTYVSRNKTDIRPLEDADDDDDDSDNVEETEDGRFEDGTTLLDDIDEEYEEIPACY